MMLPLQAVSSLDGDEARALEGHLASCAECRSELDAWRGSAAALAYAAAPLEPSPDVRSRILDSVRAESRRVESKVESKSVIPFARREPAPQVSWSRSLVAIAAVIVLALIVGLAVLWGQNRKARAVIAGLDKELTETKARLDREHVALQVLTTPGARMAELNGTNAAPAAHAMVAVDNNTRRAVFMVQGLPQAPAGKAYQLWFIAGAKPMPGKVFKTDSRGNAMMMDDEVNGEALSAGAFAVTLEREDGAQTPTGPMYLRS